MATMVIPDITGAPQTVEKPLPPARAAAAASRPVTLSNEDKAALDALAKTADLVANTTAISGVAARLPADLDANGRMKSGSMLVDEDDVPLVYVKSSVITGQIPLGGSAQPVIGPKENRMHLQIIVNHATVKAYWGQTNAVTLLTGHLIMPGVPHDFDGYLGAVYVIGDGSATVTFEEW